MAEAGTRDAFGHAQLGGVGPLIASLVKDKPQVQVPLGGRGLPAARGAASRLEDRRPAIVRRRQGGGGDWRSQGRNAVMPAITRVSDKPYRWKITEAPLSKVANVEKMLPRDFITQGRLRHHERRRARISGRS